MKSIMNVPLCLAALATISIGCASAATTIPIVNGDFEDPANADNVVNTGALPGWVKSGTSGNFNPSSGVYPGAGGSGVVGTMDGPNAAFFFDSPGSSMSQVTSHTITAGEEYTLTVAVGERDTSQTFNGWQIELFDDNGVIASTSALAAPTLNSFDDVQLIYTAQVGDTGSLGVRLVAGPTTGAGSSYVDYDNVRLTVVPEPSIAALGALGALGLLRRRRA